jgi:drug/metabolite transporter (DMT)-like permease
VIDARPLRHASHVCATMSRFSARITDAIAPRVTTATAKPAHRAPKSRHTGDPSQRQDGPVTRRGWLLFATMSVIWGVPYFFIRVAVKQLEPSVVVFGRTSIAAVLLLVIAGRSGAIAPALRRWRPVLAFAVIEMAVPWVLLTTAEQHIASGLAALLVSSVPIVGAIAAFVLGDRHALRPVRLAGIAFGIAGVGLLVGRDLRGDSAAPWSSIVMVLVVCVCYATAPFIIERRLAAVPSIGVIAVSLGVVAVVYAPFAATSLPDDPPNVNAILAVLALSLVCTGFAFIVFFRLLAEIGPARSTLITFANPVVAVALGAVFLDELVTVATFVGFVLVLTGCWLATRPPPPAVTPGESPALTTATHS